MKITKSKLEKAQIELLVNLTFEEFKPYIKNGSEKISKNIKTKGFRPGKMPYNILKQKIGEMTILEESAKIAINKTITQIIKDNVREQAIGEPKVDIVKLAPNNPLEFKITISLLPKIKLGDYKNFAIKIKKIKAQDKEIEQTINNLRESRIKEVLTNNNAEEGNKIIIDIKMFLDNVPVDGGQSKDTTIIIGKNHLVPGFDKKLIGTKKNDIREFKLPYPSEHYQKNLAGKMVEFKVTIKEVYIRELPKLDDAFAQMLKIKTIQELKNIIKKNIGLEKMQKEAQKTEMKILNKIIEKSKFDSIPEALIKREAQTMLSELEHTIKNQGGKFDDYLLSIKKTKDSLMLDIMPNALKRVKSALVVREIAIQEKITTSDEEVNKKQEALIKQYNEYEKVKQRVKEPAYKEYLRNTINNDKVTKKLMKWNVVN